MFCFNCSLLLWEIKKALRFCYSGTWAANLSCSSHEMWVSVACSASQWVLALDPALRGVCLKGVELIWTSHRKFPFNTSASRGHIWCSSRLPHSSQKAVASVCCRYFCTSEVHVNVCQAGTRSGAIMWRPQKKSGRLTCAERSAGCAKVDSVAKPRWLMLNRGPEDISVLLPGSKKRLHLFPVRSGMHILVG